MLVSGGRTVPAAYDRNTGEFLYYHVASRQFGNNAGGYEVTTAGGWFANGGAIYDLDSGKGLIGGGRKFFSRDTAYSCTNKTLVAQLLPTVGLTDDKGNGRPALRELWRAQLDPTPERIFLRAGGRLYGGRNDGTIMAVDVARQGAPALSWQGKVQGEPWSMLAAGGKLFVVTREGSLYCFGGKKVAPKTHPNIIKEFKRRISKEADVIFQRTGATDGYCIVLGLGSERLAEEIAWSSSLLVIIVDPDAKKVNAFRRRMNDYGRYGRKVMAYTGDPFAFPFPPYIASLIVSQKPLPEEPGATRTSIEHVFNALRPYGGMAIFNTPEGKQEALAALVRGMRLPGAKVETANGGQTVLKRVGPLPGSGAWTHQYADAGNTVVSKDKLVRAPLGLLWFGGPSNDAVLPRHGHGPSPQVVGGRLFIEGADMLRAVDVYTGRLLWEKELPGIGKFYDNTGHQPGANEIGSNYVSLADGVYVMSPRSCLRLDPATGETLKEFTLQGNNGQAPRWGFITIWQDKLIATSSPIKVSTGTDKLAERMTPLISEHAEWQYLAGADAQEGWTRPSFEPRGWRTGAAGFGYADNDDRTVLGDMPGKYSAVYVRKLFNVDDAMKVAKLALMVSYDDAFIAYLNGEEVAR
ncbi:MAG: hypothetical protein HQ592_01890, partial [Planctomycetes bacterium]|nr:hypothetical protein [Planctomycetota bacterium]